MRLLLVEDDHMIGESLVRGLHDDGYVVDWVKDGAAALLAIQDTATPYAVAVLDWNLPRKDGLSVLKAARSAGNTVPVLMITARDELAELKARLRSLLRRRDGTAAPARRSFMALLPWIP